MSIKRVYKWCSDCERKTYTNPDGFCAVCANKYIKMGNYFYKEYLKNKKD